MLLNALKILLVDDSTDILVVMKAVLEREGASVSSFENARDTIAQLSLQAYDTLVMDIQMPGLDGCQALTIIRNELKSEIPAIAATASSGAAELQKIQDSGFDIIVSKSDIVRVLPSELLRLVKSKQGLD